MEVFKIIYMYVLQMKPSEIEIICFKEEFVTRPTNCKAWRVFGELTQNDVEFDFLLQHSVQVKR